MPMYICPRAGSCRNISCPHFAEHEYNRGGCLISDGCPPCIPVNSGRKTGLWVALLALVFIIAMSIVWKNNHPVLQNAIVYPVPEKLVASQIIKILDGENQPNGLKVYWPLAVLDIVDVAHLYNIDPAILAVVVQAEGGLRNPTAIRKRNVFGLSRDDTLIILPDFKSGADRAAKIISLAMADDSPDSLVYYHHSEGKPPKISDYWSTLAVTYCPGNTEQWAANCRKIWDSR